MRGIMVKSHNAPSGGEMAIFASVDGFDVDLVFALSVHIVVAGEAALGNL